MPPLSLTKGVCSDETSQECCSQPLWLKAKLKHQSHLPIHIIIWQYLPFKQQKGKLHLHWIWFSDFPPIFPTMMRLPAPLLLLILLPSFSLSELVPGKMMSFNSQPGGYKMTGFCLRINFVLELKRFPDSSNFARECFSQQSWILFRPLLFTLPAFWCFLSLVKACI